MSLCTSVHHHMVVRYLPSGPWEPPHCPASILIGQCRRYQSLNSISCLALIILVVTVIIYGLPSSETFIPRNSALPPTVSSWLLLLLLFSFSFSFSTVGSYPWPILSITVFSGSTQSLSHLTHSLDFTYADWGFVNPCCVWVVDLAGLDFCFPPSPSLHSSGLVWPQEMFYRRLGRQKWSRDSFCFTLRKLLPGSKCWCRLPTGPPRPREATANQAAPPASAASLPSVSRSARPGAY